MSKIQQDGVGSVVASKAMFQRKTLQRILEEARGDQEGGAGKLGLFDLLAIGIGATIGSGVFVLTGTALPIAGGGAIVAWLIAGSICSLSSLSYMELSSRLPTKGSCYVFSYHALGELASVVASVCLTMEYGISSAGIARSWSLKLAKAAGISKSVFLCFNGSVFGSEACSDQIDSYFDPIAGGLLLLATALLARGVDVGKIVINSFTLAKLCLVAFMIIAGFACWKGETFASEEAFLPEGVEGLVKVTPLLFWGFIGFDEICCMAAKASDPVNTMPYAMGGSLLIGAVVSALAQLALVGMVDLHAGPEPASFQQAFQSRGLFWVRWIVDAGELTLLPLVVFLALLPQPEVTAALSSDGLLPSIFRKRNRDGTFVIGSLVAGSLAMVAAMVVPFASLNRIISIGVLLGFNLTNLSLLNVRYGNGGALRVPSVNSLLWTLMLAMAVAGYCCQQGLLEPTLAGEPISVAALGGFGVSSTFGLSIACFLAFGFETKCDMSDSRAYKAPGVPFLPAFALFCNFFLMASFSWIDLAYFGAFLGLFLVMYFFNLLWPARSRHRFTFWTHSDDACEAASESSSTTHCSALSGSEASSNIESSCQQQRSAAEV